MNLAETRYNDVEWIHLAQEMDEQPASCSIKYDKYIDYLRTS